MPNDFTEILNAADINQIFVNGKQRTTEYSELLRTEKAFIQNDEITENLEVLVID